METAKVLIIVDGQHDFTYGALRNEDAIRAIPNIVKKINEFDGDYILLTMDTHDENYLESNEGKMLPVVHCVKDTEGWKIEKEIQKAVCLAEGRNDKNRVIYFEKPTFGSTVLADFLDLELLEKYDHLDIEYVGFCTDICVVSNVLMDKAFLYDKADITVDASCCAGVTPEKHKAALETMKSCQINVINE